MYSQAPPETVAISSRNLSFQSLPNPIALMMMPSVGGFLGKTDAALLIAVGIAVGQQNDVIDQFGREVLAILLDAGWQPLVDFCAAARRHHADVRFQTGFVLDGGRRNDDFGVVVET